MEQDTDDAFAELGLKPDATEYEVKSAWRRLVSQWHPDRNASAAAVAKMQRINRAFKAIRQTGFATGRPASSADSSARSRASADAARARADAGAERSRRAQQRNSERADADAAAPGRPRRAISRKLKLTLEEAAAGSTKDLRGRISDACADCDGVGYRVLGGHCPQCHGSGAVRQRSWFGWVGTQSECTACHGGGIARQHCASCDGSGSQSREYRFSVRIPLGVRDGDQLHVDGRRHKSGPAPVDLNIRVELLPHRFLHLDADGTIRCEVPVDGFAWIANRSVEVPTLAGLRRLQLDRERLGYRLRGEGFPVERRGVPGDQLITITPIFPASLNNDQRILLDQLIATSARGDGSDVDARLQRWNDAMRELRERDAGTP